MRLLRWACAGILALALTDRANAQDFQSALTGIKPSDVQFKQVDISGALRATNPVIESGSQNRFSLSNFFRRLTGPSTKTIIGRSNIPAPQYPSAIMPLAPIMSTVPKRQ